MQLLQQFRDYITAHRLFTVQQQLLLAVSGGVDSVVLCELCKQAGYPFVIAHCNFGLRGEESMRDEQFVRSLGHKYDVQVLVKQFDTRAYAAAHKLSVQEAARELRYSWFREVLGRSGEVGKSGSPEAGDLKSEIGGRRSEGSTHDSPLTTHYLATAHHADDNIETMLMHFFRGTGVHGLRGMLPKQDVVVRPLLFARKSELLQFAEQHQLMWVEDSSNATDKYSRNYFRHQVIPMLQQVYPAVENNLLDNLQRFADTEVLYQQAVQRHLKKLLTIRGNEVHIPVLKLRNITPLQAVVYEVIHQYGFTAAQVKEVINLLDSETGKYVQSTTHRIIRNRNWLIIAPQQHAEAATIIVEQGEREIPFANGKLVLQTMHRKKETLPGDKTIGCFDANAICFPLILRRWKQGDYFYPLGMPKKKKVARFLVDQKLSMTDKENVWVLEMDKKIIWIVGMRIDNRFKVTDATRTLLQINLVQV